MHRELVITEDGSHTFFVRELAEHYHSVHGAIQESQHVFIKHGLQYIQKERAYQPIRILEVGFGTGLNAILTFLQAGNSDIQYTAIEPYPVSMEEFQELNYPELLSAGKDSFLEMHESKWNSWIALNEKFSLYKIRERIENITLQDTFHLIYYDAFAPQVQPELWTQEIFKKLYDQLNPGGILVTYSAKGSVKRALKFCGFKLEALPGPPGKREITRALRL